MDKIRIGKAEREESTKGSLLSPSFPLGTKDKAEDNRTKGDKVR